MGLRIEMKLILWTSKPVNRKSPTSYSASFFFFSLPLSFLELSQWFSLRALDLCTGTSQDRLCSSWEWKTLRERFSERSHANALRGKVGNPERVHHPSCLHQICHQTGLHQSQGSFFRRGNDEPSTYNSPAFTAAGVLWENVFIWGRMKRKKNIHLQQQIGIWGLCQGKKIIKQTS